MFFFPSKQTGFNAVVHREPAVTKVVAPVGVAKVAAPLIAHPGLARIASPYGIPYGLH